MSEGAIKTVSAGASLVEVKPSDHARAPIGGRSIAGWGKRWTSRLNGRTGLPLVERVLLARGLSGGSSSPEVDAFLNPSLKHLHDPSLMAGVDRAAERILSAANAGEQIVVYGDYDVDGVSASAILFHSIRTICPDAHVETYVPHRLEEGYGLNAQSIRELCDAGANVIVSVDCGITAIEPAKVARDAGVDLIVTDHHNFAEDRTKLPDAYALVHPRLPGGGYPFGDLCGAGVAFKLAWRLMTLAHGSQRLPDAWRDVLLELLALASLGVIADVVPLLGENRVIARFGLSRLKHTNNVGLKALIAASGLDGENVAAEDVGFKLGPRLNACGRMGHAREAVELLTTSEGSRAGEIAEHLTRQNNQRRATEKAIFDHACELAEKHGMTGEDRRAIVLAHSEWHPGVVGIVCSRLVERYARPTLLLREHEGTCHGSGRSVDGVNLHAMLSGCSSLLTQFGGHDMAAGMKLDATNFAAFQDAFVSQVNSVLPVHELVHKAVFDSGAMLGELTVANVQTLERLAPFGRDNPNVRLRVAGVRVMQRPQLMGSTGKHLALVVGEAGAGFERAIRCVGFNKGEWIDRLKVGQSLDVFGTPKINRWGGKMNVELELLDIAESPTS